MHRIAAALTVLVLGLALPACGGEDEPAESDATPAAAQAPGPPKAGEPVYWDGGAIEPGEGDGVRPDDAYVSLVAEDDEVTEFSTVAAAASCPGTGADYSGFAFAVTGTMPVEGGAFELEGGPAEGFGGKGNVRVSGEITAQGVGSGTAELSDLRFPGPSGEFLDCEPRSIDVEVRAVNFVATRTEPAEVYYGSAKSADPVAIRFNADHTEVVEAHARHVLVCPPADGEDVLVNEFTTASSYPSAPVAEDGSFELEVSYDTTSAALFRGQERLKGGGTLQSTISGRLEGGEVVDAMYSASLDWTGAADLRFTCGLTTKAITEPTTDPVELELEG